jgi:hypothetical protein
MDGALHSICNKSMATHWFIERGRHDWFIERSRMAPPAQLRSDVCSREITDEVQTCVWGCHCVKASRSFAKRMNSARETANKALQGMPRQLPEQKPHLRFINSNSISLRSASMAVPELTHLSGVILDSCCFEQDRFWHSALHP